MSVCAEAKRGTENSKIPASIEEGRAIIDVVRMVDSIEKIAINV